jgi:hypothetical protein
MCEHFVMPSVRSREIARSQRSCVQHCEDALKALNLGYGLLGVHFVSISAIGVAVVKRSGQQACPAHAPSGRQAKS